MSARILVVEDERHLAEGISENLQQEGYAVEAVGDGESALARWRSGGVDLMILDVMLPKRDGFSVCKAIRDEGGRLPILFLTAKTSDDDRVYGLELGGDDYLGKPFNLRELLLRVRGMLRRQGWYEQTLKTARIGNVTVDFGKGEVIDPDGERSSLAEKEALILRLLVEHADQVVSREEILERVWGYEVSPSTRAVEHMVLRLRKLIEPDPERPRYLHTVRGLGYRFSPAGEA
ncbi:MAG: response regulator transcription factor [Polyangia bacterium]|jgi:DNA-binding response OmpR family regulator